MKAHIVGIPGSGKTTLARWFGKQSGFPSFDLDPVVWSTSGERTPPEIERRLEEIRRGPGWVTEGAYQQEWLRPHLDAANIIVWLDLPLLTCITRIVRRHVKAEFTGNNPHPGWRKLWRFLLYTRRSARRQRGATLLLLDSYSEKVVRCRSSRQVAAFQKRVAATPASFG